MNPDPGMSTSTTHTREAINNYDKSLYNIYSTIDMTNNISNTTNTTNNTKSKD